MPTYDEALLIGMILLVVFSAARLTWLGDALGRAARLLSGKRR